MWLKRGLVWAPGGEEAWASSHALLPTPHVMGDRIRVFVAAMDEHKFGRIGWVDVALNDPGRVLGVSRQPVLDLGQLGAFDDSGVTPSCVLRVRDALHLYYVGWQRTERTPYMLYTGLALSHDEGETFRRVSPVPILDRTPREPYSRGAAFVLWRDSRYLAFYWSCTHWSVTQGKAHYNNVIRRAESADGQHFGDGAVAVPLAGAHEFSVGRPWVLCDRDRFRMWYTIRSHDRPDAAGYAESLDGHRWTRRDEKAGLGCSSSGWDSEMVCYPAVVRIGDKLIAFYNGNGHGKTGFGWAEAASATLS